MFPSRKELLFYVVQVTPNTFQPLSRGDEALERDTAEVWSGLNPDGTKLTAIWLEEDIFMFDIQCPSWFEKHGDPLWFRLKEALERYNIARGMSMVAAETARRLGFFVTPFSPA